MKPLAFAVVFLVMLGGWLWFRGGSSNPSTEAVQRSVSPQSSGAPIRPERFPGVVAPGGAYGGHQLASLSEVDQRALRDSEFLLQSPLPETLQAFCSLTNAGLSSEMAKRMLRPIVFRLGQIALSEDQMMRTDRFAASERERVRAEAPDGPVDIGLVLKSIAAVNQLERAHWTAKREDATNQLMVDVIGLGVADPRALFEDLLLIRPVQPLPPVMPPP